jgi:hypothetical protein
MQVLLGPPDFRRTFTNSPAIVNFLISRDNSSSRAKMPAPTALLRRPEELAEAASVPLPTEGVYTDFPFEAKG